MGYLKKTHGIKGDLTVIFNDDIIHKQSLLDFLFFEIDGLLVPFKIEREQENLSNFKFKLIDSKEAAMQYVGCKVFLDKDDIQIDIENISATMLIGFTLFDQNKGEIGEILAVDDYSGNLVLTVDYESEEVLIPYSEEFVTSFDMNNTTIELNCPEGIFDLSE